MEKIICSAIWYKDLPAQKFLPVNISKGMVVCGLRHVHCVDVLHSMTGIRSVTNAPDGAGEMIQGFLTNRNRFVDRIEGLEIASKADQIIKKHSPINELTSEDLY